jgi:hypothetical protein
MDLNILLFFSSEIMSFSSSYWKGYYMDIVLFLYPNVSDVGWKENEEEIKGIGKKRSMKDYVI